MIFQDLMDLRIPPEYDLEVRRPRPSGFDEGRLYLVLSHVDTNKQLRYMLTFDMCRHSEISLQHLVDYLIIQMEKPD